MREGGVEGGNAHVIVATPRGEKRVGDFNGDEMTDWQVTRRMMASSREPFMAPSESGPRWRLRKEGMVWGSIPSGAVFQNYTVCWVEHPSPQVVSRDVMAGCCPLCRDDFVE